MKTPKIKSSKMITKIAFFSVLLIVACKGRDGSSANAQGKVKPPAVDIHTTVITQDREALEQHILAGTNLNEKDPFGGSSPLISAAVFGKPDMAKLLIEAGADLDFQNNDGSTALISAAFFCRPDIVRMLLDAGVDKTIRNNYGATAYESVLAPYDEVKGSYDMMGKMLEPMGLKLDHAHLEKTRPEIAAMLK